MTGFDIKLSLFISLSLSPTFTKLKEIHRGCSLNHTTSTTTPSSSSSSPSSSSSSSTSSPSSSLLWSFCSIHLIRKNIRVCECACVRAGVRMGEKWQIVAVVSPMYLSTI